MTIQLRGLIAAALVTAVAIVYLAVILDEGIHPDDKGRVALIAGALFLGAALSVAGALARHAIWQRLAYGIALAIVAVMAWLGMWSIGLLLVPAVLVLIYALGAD